MPDGPGAGGPRAGLAMAAGSGRGAWGGAISLPGDAGRGADGLAARRAIALVMAGIGLGWLSRTAPSLPFVVLSLPIRAGLGIALVLLSLTTLALTLAGAFGSLPWVYSTQ